MSSTIYKTFASPNFIKKLIGLDHDAIEQVVREYTEHLFKGSLGLGFSEHEATELVQNVWGTFFDVLPNFKANSHIRTFLFGILYNKAKELKREKAKLSKHEPIDGIMEERFDENGSWRNHIVDPERFMAASQTLEIIEKCLDKLPLTQKMAFCLKEIDDHGTSDICKILEVTTTNLGVLLYRAKNRLRECIETKIKV
ncbi:sigma-70 family RNA polymerase sigma factor [Halobacteriovorax sp.]|uniref:sigma-70 family RNA polymerase sigma factor n=1 Tax=Halobacteriovorax sp. TaxID=2020862 RepID=UPI003AF2B9A0